MVYSEKIKLLFNDKFSKNTAWIIFERILQMAISLVVGMMTARYLGPSNYGIINYVAAFISFAIPICGLGLEGILVKRYIDSPNDIGKIAGTAMFFKFFVAVGCSIIICIVINLTNAGDNLKTIIGFLESIRLLFKSTEAIEYWFQSELKSRITSIIRIMGYMVMSFYRIVLLMLGSRVEWFAFATSLDMIVISIFYLLAYKRECGMKLQVDFKYGIELLKDSYHFIISGLMVVIYSQMDKIMIQSMLGDYDVGLYSASYTLCNLWFFIPNALIISAQPLIMQYKTKDENKYLIALKRLYAGIFWLGVIVAFTVTLFSKYIILILYGREYMGACGPLIIGSWYGTFAQLGNARGIWILCENKNKYVKYYLGIGAVLNLMLNIIMIPKFGISGAAIATLITQVMTSVFAPLLFKETRSFTKLVIDSFLFKW